MPAFPPIVSVNKGSHTAANLCSMIRSGDVCLIATSQASPSSAKAPILYTFIYSIFYAHVWAISIVVFSCYQELLSLLWYSASFGFTP